MQTRNNTNKQLNILETFLSRKYWSILNVIDDVIGYMYVIKMFINKM